MISIFAAPPVTFKNDRVGDPDDILRTMRDYFPTRPVIAVIGSGAIGSYYGGRLAYAGLPVRFLFRSDYECVCREGLTVRSVDGNFTIPPQELRAYRSTTDMPEADLVLVTLKSTDNASAETLIGPILHEKTAILMLQNGLGNEEHLAKLFGADRILGGNAFICVNRVSPGVIHHSDHGRIDLGEFVAPSDSPRGRAIAKLFSDAGITTRVVDDLIRSRWMKLTWNIPFNGLSAILDLTTDELLATPEGVQLVTAIIEEIIATASAAGITLPTDLAQRQIDATRTMGTYVTSTQSDRRRGNPLEIESIFARPLAVAHSGNIPTPLLKMLKLCLVRINGALASRSDNC